MYFLEWIVNSVNGCSGVSESFLSGSSVFFNIVAAVSATFIAMGIALFTISMINTTINTELRLFIKYDFAVSAMVTILVPLFCLSITNYFTLSYSLIITMEIICAGIMVLSVTRLINRVYYSTMQNVSHNSYKVWKKLIGKNYLHHTPLIPKRYDVIAIKMRLYSKAYASLKRPFAKLPEDLPTGDIDTLNFEFDEYVQYYANKAFDEYVINNNGEFVTEDFIAFLKASYKKELKTLTPKIQDTTEVYKICMDYIERCRINNIPGEEYIRYCILLLSVYIRYATKHQNQSFWNKAVGRTNYINSDDSFIYTLYGDMLNEAESIGLIKHNDSWMFYIKAADLKVSYVYAHMIASSVSRSVPKSTEFCSALPHDYAEKKKKCDILRIGYMLLFSLLIIDIALDVIPFDHTDIVGAYVYLILGIAILSLLVAMAIVWSLKRYSVKRYLLSVAAIILIAVIAVTIIGYTPLCNINIPDITKYYDHILSEVAILFMIPLMVKYTDITDGIRIHNRQSVFRMESLGMKVTFIFVILMIFSAVSVLAYYIGDLL